jgi:nucleoside phosphorylase
MRTLLVVAAEGFEFAGIRRAAQRRMKVAWGIRFAEIVELNGLRLLLAAHGPGPRLAGMAADAAFLSNRPEALVSTGLCGGVDLTLRVGDVVAATRVIAPEKGLEFRVAPVSKVGVNQTGVVFSVDHVAGTVKEKTELRKQGATAVEMESAAVAERAAYWNIPFFCVRAVSDGAGDEFGIDLNEARDRDGRFSTFRILKQACRRPWSLFPELARLKRNSDLAAVRLGDFFANCSF